MRTVKWMTTAVVNDVSNYMREPIRGVQAHLCITLASLGTSARKDLRVGTCTAAVPLFGVCV